MPNILTQLELEVEVEGQKQLVTFDLQDAGARELIAALGNAVKWLGVTTTELVDNVTTDPDIVVGGETKTADAGGMAQYEGEEFVYDGTKWQSIGKNNFGALAFKNSASGDFTPQGDVSAPAITVTGDSTGTVNSITDVGTLPAWTVSGTKATFSAGTLPTKGADQTVVTATGTITASAPTFTVTQGSVSVS
jgi:hypothetical protein